MDFSEFVFEKYKSISRRSKITFISTFLIGLFAHLFYLMNVLNNYDSVVWIPRGYGDGVQSGRWALTLLGETIRKIWGDYNIPVFNGAVALVLLSLSAVVIVSIFDLQNIFYCVLVGGLCISFPAITSMMFYSYTSPYYAFAILITAGAVWVAMKGTISSAIISIFLLAFSLGIYQAYFPFGVCLLLLALLQKCLSTESTFKQNLLLGIRYLVILILSLVLYMIILKIMLQIFQVSLSDYQGINQMGQISLQEIPEMLKAVYSTFIKMPFESYCAVNGTGILRLGILGLYLVDLGLIFYYAYKMMKKKLILLQTIVILAVLPIAVNLIIIMCFKSTIYTLMVYATVFIFILPVVLIDKTEVTGKLKSLVKACRWITQIILCVVLLNYIWLSNGNYVQLYYSDQQTNNYYTTLVTRMRSAEGYTDEMPVAYIGFDIEDASYTNGIWDTTPFMYGGKNSEYINAYSRKWFISAYLGYEPVEVSYEEGMQLSEDPLVQEMPRYPDEGSIKVINGVLVVKF